jgi:hypothetical protein
VPAETAATVGQSRVADGMRVVDVDGIARALAMLGMTGEESKAQDA